MSSYIRPMLAAKGGPETFTYPCFISPKLDGIRGLITGGNAQSRSGKPFANHALRAWLATLPKGLDGELVTGPPNAPEAFERTCSVVNSHHADIANTKFYVFDYYPFGASTPSHRRLQQAEKLATCGIPNLALVKQRLCESPDKAARMAEYYLAEGYEGLCARGVEGRYKFGRCANATAGLIAYKPFIDCDVRVLWPEEKMTNDNELGRTTLGYAKRSSHAAGKTPANTLGGFHVVALNGDFEGVTFDLGTGTLTAKECKALWDSGGLVGRTATIKYQAHGSKDKPRAPIFLRWRLDAEYSADPMRP